MVEIKTLEERKNELIVKGKAKKLDESICDKIAKEYNTKEHINLLKEVYETIYSGGYPQASGAPQDIYKFVQDYECYTEVPFTYRDKLILYNISYQIILSASQHLRNEERAYCRKENKRDSVNHAGK